MLVKQMIQLRAARKPNQIFKDKKKYDRKNKMWKLQALD